MNLINMYVFQITYIISFQITNNVYCNRKSNLEFLLTLLFQSNSSQGQTSHTAGTLRS